MTGDELIGNGEQWPVSTERDWFGYRRVGNGGVAWGTGRVQGGVKMVEIVRVRAGHAETRG